MPEEKFIFESSPRESPPETSPEKEKRECGHEVEITASFRRHFDPNVDPETGMSLDELSEKGQGQGVKLGQKLEGKQKGYSSPKERAQQSIDIALQNASENADIINQTLPKGNKRNLAFNIQVKKELDTARNLKPIWLKAGQWAESQIENGAASKDKKYDLQVQYCLDHPEEARELNAQTPRESAQDIARRVDIYRKMAKKLYDGSKVNLENITHGPKLEPFLKETMIRIVDDKQIKGFQNLEEIGGAFGPGENFEVVIKRDEEKKEHIFIKVKDEEFEIDLKELDKLNAEYTKRIKEEKNS